MYYKVLKNTIAAGKPVKAGDVIELSEDEGRSLINMGRVIATEAPKKNDTPKRKTRVVTDLSTPEDE